MSVEVPISDLWHVCQKRVEQTCGMYENVGCCIHVTCMFQNNTIWNYGIIYKKAKIPQVLQRITRKAKLPPSLPRITKETKNHQVGQELPEKQKEHQVCQRSQRTTKFSKNYQSTIKLAKKYQKSQITTKLSFFHWHNLLFYFPIPTYLFLLTFNLKFL